MHIAPLEKIFGDARDFKHARCFDRIYYADLICLGPYNIDVFINLFVFLTLTT